MKFIELEVRTVSIVHGFDEDNVEIIEEFEDELFTTKLVSVDRIQSVTEEYILVKSSHSRVIYWEYNYSMQELAAKFKRAGLMIS